MFGKMRLTLLAVLLILCMFSEAQTPVYLNILSHSEITDVLDYDGSSSGYNTLRTILKEVCDTIISKQAKYNMQIDANFIKGALIWEDAASNPNDILEWANNSPYIDVDGHNHFDPIVNPYKYSDLAKLLDSCGVVLTHNILGGVTYADTVVGNFTFHENWTEYQNPVPGFTFTDFYWQADIVWGTATPGHVADYTHFGVWKPKGGSSPTEFGTHDPNGNLTHIGGGCKEDIRYAIDVQTGQLVRTTDEVIANIKGIVDYIQTLPSGPNDFYTMNMMMHFRDMPNIPHFADSIGVIIDGLQDYVDQGKIVWTTLGEKYDIWYAEHTDPNDYFNYDCADISVGVEEAGGNTEKITIYPNPATDLINFSLPQNTSIRSVEICNLLGRKIYSQNNLNAISLSGFENGIYIVRIVDENDDSITQKIMKY